MKITKKHIKGFTLVEAMVATLLASLMSISVISIYVNQTVSIAAETQREASTLEANQAYELVTRLLRQAPRNALVITYANPVLNGNTLEIANDNIEITFELPAGFNSWPNNNPNTVPPFNQNIVRISWDNSTADQFLIRVTNANTVANLNLDPVGQAIAGNNTGDDARIINFDVWPMQDQSTAAAAVNNPAISGYFVSLTTRAANPDFNYINPADPNGPLRNFRTHTVSGIVSPRN